MWHRFSAASRRRCAAVKRPRAASRALWHHRKDEEATGAAGAKTAAPMKK